MVKPSTSMPITSAATVQCNVLAGQPQALAVLSSAIRTGSTRPLGHQVEAHQDRQPDLIPSRKLARPNPEGESIQLHLTLRTRFTALDRDRRRMRQRLCGP